MKSLKTFACFSIITLSLTVSVFGLKPCKNFDTVTSSFGGVCAEATTEWMSSSNNCCAPSSGSAMVTQIYFDSGGKIIFTEISYIPIGQAQSEMGCGAV
ncbi:hypothetical protein [Dyadobacter luticola]|uniref:hypothetical protein n=1 Tax=Dyadobacter luticola TaxID=1979387 RepID=UPI00197A87BE|nr:hypothetical protein [Dyadobacter luticola]